MSSEPTPPRRGPGRPAAPSLRLRIPESQYPAVVAYLDAYRQPAIARDARSITLDSPEAGLVVFASRVRAGFPSPADDYVEDVLDLNRHLIRHGHEEATFVLRVEGWSMLGAGIHDGDEIIVDRAIPPSEGRIVVAVVNGDLTVKRLKFDQGKPVLAAENPHFTDITFREGEELVIWGVVTRVLHRV